MQSHLFFQLPPKDMIFKNQREIQKRKRHNLTSEGQTIRISLINDQVKTTQLKNRLKINSTEPYGSNTSTVPRSESWARIASAGPTTAITRLSR